MGASEPETDLESDREPETEEPELPWFTVNAIDTGEAHVQWGWVRGGTFTDLVGEATVGFEQIDQQLGVAISLWQQRWQEILQAQMEVQAREAGEAEAEAA